MKRDLLIKLINDYLDQEENKITQQMIANETGYSRQTVNEYIQLERLSRLNENKRIKKII